MEGRVWTDGPFLLELQRCHRCRGEARKGVGTQAFPFFTRCGANHLSMTSDCRRVCIIELLAQTADLLAHETVWQRPSDLDAGGRERDGGGLGLPLDHGKRTWGQGTVFYCLGLGTALQPCQGERLPATLLTLRSPCTLSTLRTHALMCS